MIGIEFDARGIELKVHRKGISLSPGAQKIYGVLLKKLGKEVVIENEVAKPTCERRTTKGYDHRYWRL
jgi:hypothetical protein